MPSLVTRILHLQLAATAGAAGYHFLYRDLRSSGLYSWLVTYPGMTAMRLLDPETAHHFGTFAAHQVQTAAVTTRGGFSPARRAALLLLTTAGVWAAAHGFAPIYRDACHPSVLRTSVFGLEFANPIGLAAGA